MVNGLTQFSCITQSQLQTFSETKGKGLTLLKIGKKDTFFFFGGGGRGVKLGLFFLGGGESFGLFEGRCVLKMSGRGGGWGVGEGKEKISRD